MARTNTAATIRKTERIAFRLSANHYVELCNAAKDAGVSVNVLARSLALKHGDFLVIRRSLVADPALLKRLERIGNNLNQIVRYAHITGIVDEKIEPLCDQIAEIVYRDLEDF
jgi:hypothetical protein